MKKSKTNEPIQITPSEPRATPTKRYDEAFKQQAVEHWLKSDQPGTQLAAELGISYPSLKEWKRRYVGDATPIRADLEAENRALKAELARVREQRDILKKNFGHPLRTVQERYQRVEAMNGEHAIAQLCATLDVTDSGYHAWVKAGPQYARAAGRGAAAAHPSHSC